MNTIPHGDPFLFPAKPRNVRKVDPLVAATKKAYRESVFGQLEALLKERSKWKRRLTIAENKLESVNIEIGQFAGVLSGEADKAGRKGKVLS